MPPIKRRNYQTTARMSTGGPAPKRRNCPTCLLNRVVQHEQPPSSSSEDEVEDTSVNGSVASSQVLCSDDDDLPIINMEDVHPLEVQPDFLDMTASDDVSYYHEQLPDGYDDPLATNEQDSLHSDTDGGFDDGDRPLLNLLADEDELSISTASLSSNDIRLRRLNGELDTPPYGPYIRRVWPQRHGFPPGWKNVSSWAPLRWPDFYAGVEWRGRSYPSIPDLRISEDSARLLQQELEFDGTLSTFTLGSFSYHWWTINRYTRPKRVKDVFKFLIGNLDTWGKKPFVRPDPKVDESILGSMDI
jgi:hypothetical protein